MKKILSIIILLMLASTVNAVFYTAQKDWFQRVAEGEIPGYTIMEKFGENPQVDTGTDPEDVWDGEGLYAFSTNADIDEIASSDNADTTDVTIYGLDSNWEATNVTITLTGQTVITLPVAFIRVYRMVNVGTTDIAGTVYVAANTATWTAGVPAPATTIRAQIVDGNNQTLMCIYTVPAGKTGYFWAGYIGMNKSSANYAVFTWRARLFGGVFTVKSKISTVGTGSSTWQYHYKIPLMLPEKTDVLIRCDEVEANGIGVSGGFTVLLKDN